MRQPAPEFALAHWLNSNDVIDFSAVLPGFSLRVSEIF